MGVDPRVGAKLAPSWPQSTGSISSIETVRGGRLIERVDPRVGAKLDREPTGNNSLVESEWVRAGCGNGSTRGSERELAIFRRSINGQLRWRAPYGWRGVAIELVDPRVGKKT